MQRTIFQFIKLFPRRSELILIMLFMCTEIQRLSKWMAKGKSQVSHFWNWSLKISMGKKLEWNRLELARHTSINWCLVYYRFRLLHIWIFLGMYIYTLIVFVWLPEKAFNKWHSCSNEHAQCPDIDFWYHSPLTGTRASWRNSWF